GGPPRSSPPSLHDALPISRVFQLGEDMRREAERFAQACRGTLFQREFQQGGSRGGAGVPLETVFEDLLAPGALDSLEAIRAARRSEEHTSELQSRENLVCR